MTWVCGGGSTKSNKMSLAMPIGMYMVGESFQGVLPPD